MLEHAPVVPMSESLTPQDAARALSEARSWEGALASRTAGITWMIWGMVTPATFLTYAFVAVLSDAEGLEVPWFVWNVLWVPWIGMGVVATAALWRSAALRAPALGSRAQRRRAMWGGFASSGVLFVTFLLLEPDSAVVPLGAIGLMWGLMSAFNVWSADSHGRFVGIVVGAALLASAILLTVLDAPVEVSGVVSILVSALVPFAAGSWHLSRA